MKLNYALAAILLAAQVSAGAQTPSDQDDIVVIARKLDKLKIHFGGSKKNGVIVSKNCRVTQSSGDVEVDPIGCKAVTYCVDQRLSKGSDFNKCVNDHAKILANELLDRRRSARDTQ